ncbi:MATE family efflux transporter [Clostridium sp. WB02_MRS01]|uniref:MATE family efflux transporter n=1 Tax=Clostridium sp. WB02_MRS01 TaxID=2605777 RepID=UPI0018A6AEB9|nr:MATE family efflux transporter [Clostridium sp. WB02_MRS01]
MAIPLVLTSISSILIGIIDQAFVAHISVSAYAGVGFVTMIINSLVGVLGAISISFNILGSKLKGENDLNGLRIVYSSTFFLNLFISIIIVILINVFMESILSKGFALTGDTLLEAEKYLEIYSLSIILNMLIFVFSAIFKIFRKTSHIFLVTLIVNLLNVVLDYIMIFGKFGFPSLGSQGAAIASIIALVINLLLYFLIARKFIHMKFQFVLKDISQVFKKALPFIGQECIEEMVFVVGISAVIARLGELELATYNLLFMIINILLMPMYAYQQANMSIISEEYGKKEFNSIAQTSKKIVQILLVIFVVLFILILSLKTYFIKFITPDANLINSSNKYLWIAIFIQAFNYIKTIYRSSCQSLGVSKFVFKITSITNIITLLFVILFVKNLYTLFILMGLSHLVSAYIFICKFKAIIKRMYEESSVKMDLL